MAGLLIDVCVSSRKPRPFEPADPCVFDKCIQARSAFLKPPLPLPGPLELPPRLPRRPSSRPEPPRAATWRLRLVPRPQPCRQLSRTQPTGGLPRPIPGDPRRPLRRKNSRFIFFQGGGIRVFPGGGRGRLPRRGATGAESGTRSERRAVPRRGAGTELRAAGRRARAADARAACGGQAPGVPRLLPRQVRPPGVPFRAPEQQDPGKGPWKTVLVGFGTLIRRGVQWGDIS